MGRMVIIVQQIKWDNTLKHLMWGWHLVRTPQRLSLSSLFWAVCTGLRYFTDKVFIYLLVHSFIHSKDFIYSFLERGEGRERNTNEWLPLTCPLLRTWPTTQACALTGNQTGDLSVCSLCSIHWATPARAVYFLNNYLFFSITVDVRYYISFRCTTQWLDTYVSY